MNFSSKDFRHQRMFYSNHAIHSQDNINTEPNLPIVPDSLIQLSYLLLSEKWSVAAHFGKLYLYLFIYGSKNMSLSSQFIEKRNTNICDLQVGKLDWKPTNPAMLSWSGILICKVTPDMIEGSDLTQRSQGFISWLLFVRTWNWVKDLSQQVGMNAGIWTNNSHLPYCHHSEVCLLINDNWAPQQSQDNA